jgi:hypothetical protein
VVSFRPNHDPAPSEPSSRGTRAKLLRWAVNLWLVFHISAIVIAPASVSPSSDLVQSTWYLFRPYLQLLFLNHGYHFFAPDPGESVLLAFAAERADGSVIRGRIPNGQIVPRLLYHRHFMLTEHTKEAPEEFARQWFGSYAEHICRKYGATQVNLTRQIHYLPTMEMVRDGVRLDDPASYEEQSLGVFRCGER